MNHYDETFIGIADAIGWRMISPPDGFNSGVMVPAESVVPSDIYISVRFIGNDTKLLLQGHLGLTGTKLAAAKQCCDYKETSIVVSAVKPVEQIAEDIEKWLLPALYKMRESANNCIKNMTNVIEFIQRLESKSDDVIVMESAVPSEGAINFVLDGHESGVLYGRGSISFDVNSSQVAFTDLVMGRNMALKFAAFLAEQKVDLEPDLKDLGCSYRTQNSSKLGIDKS